MGTHNNNYEPISQIRAAILGCAIGDAMGVPVEFKSRPSLKQDPVTGYRGYGSHNVPAGTWSDDTSMTLASLDSLARGLDYDDMMRRFCDWYDNAAYTATDMVFDIGIATRQALMEYQRGVPALQCGGKGEYNNGNGSLMRISPAAVYCKYKMPLASLDERMDVIHKTSMLTHAHPRSMMGCGIYSIIMMELLESRSKDAIYSGIEKTEAYYRSQPDFSDELPYYQRVFDLHRTTYTEEDINSSGYVVSTLEAALWCTLTTENYSECILKAVNLGSDTDTVAAVAGAMAGELYGMEGIPSEWYDGLLRKEMIETLCDAFIHG